MSDIQKNLEDEFQDVHKELEDQRESIPKIFHYTNLESAKCILASKSLWMTNYRCLNDDEEIFYGANIVKDYFYEQSKIGQDLRKRILDDFDRMIKNGYQPFITSFCEVNNSNHAWCHYANHCKGVVIVFNEGLGVSSSGRFNDVPYTFYKVIYNNYSQYKICEKFFNIFDKFLTQNSNEETVHARAACLISNILVFLGKFKSSDWQNEFEWRAIYHNIVEPDGNFTRPFPFGDLIEKITANNMISEKSQENSKLILNSLRFDFVDIDSIIIGKFANFGQSVILLKKVLIDAGCDLNNISKIKFIRQE